jgi:cyclohexanecarboxyl-CoA dehydrogenase
MDFDFTEDQQMFRQTIRKFAREVILPRRKEWDREKKYPRPIGRLVAELGLTAPFVSYVHNGIIVEEVSYVDFNCAYAVLPTGESYAMYGLPGVPDEVAEPIREALRKHETNLSLCFTEPEAGSDYANISTTAIRAENEWIINGCKNSVSFLGESDNLLVWAKTKNEKSVWATTAFLVPANTPGVSRPVLHDDMGTLGTPRGVVYFDNVHIPKNYMVGEEGRGFELAADLYDTNRAMIGLMCIGPAQASIDETVEYAKKRVVFGNPISKYQAVSFALAEAHTLLEAARLLCYKTLWLADHKRRRSMEGAMVKWWVPQVCFDIVHKCMLFHGHYGYTRDLPFEQRLRDIVGWQTGDGTIEVCKLIIARKLFGGKEYTG